MRVFFVFVDKSLFDLWCRGEDRRGKTNGKYLKEKLPELLVLVVVVVVVVFSSVIVAFPSFSSHHRIERPGWMSAG
jgi:hypothetical protein